jgi:hypothetical protein
MVIDKDSLETLNLIYYGVPDNVIEKHAEKINEIYSVIHRKVEHSKNPEHTLNYSEDMVCEDCGSNEWHVNLSYNNRNGGWWYGEIDVMGQETGDEVWCHKCEGFCQLVAPDEYEEDGE